MYPRSLFMLLFFCFNTNVGHTDATNQHKEWEGIEGFAKFGYDVLPCPTYQRSQCCICKSIVKQIEKLIKNPSASRNYEVDAHGYRMNQRQSYGRKKKKKQAKRMPYVESMAGIDEALENVCYSNVSMSIPKIETRVEEATDLYFFTCVEFTKDFEEFIQKRFFDYSNNVKRNDSNAIIHDVCVKDTGLCDGLDKTYSNAPYWPITLKELKLLSGDLKEAYDILNDIISINMTIATNKQKARNSQSQKRIEQRLLINKLFFKIGHAAALSRSSNQQLWYKLFTNNIVEKEYEIAKTKLRNKIHAANSFHDDDLYDEEEEE